MFYLVTVTLPGRSRVWIPGLFTTTFYLPNKVVRQFGLLQYASKGDSIGFLRESKLSPSTISDFMTVCHERIAIPFRRTSTSIIQTMEYNQEIQALIEA